ncbi:hypothetical protein L195_g006655 [Trifolium pratense]|uniref:Uncharacterized protein n=1 Tax=Trifolium pratense TaxID=57577 RepID=A0A2K3P477_TRIPR|nr:hypothetical protein L195_g006655 [Trifolium pratense]
MLFQPLKATAQQHHILLLHKGLGPCNISIHSLHKQLIRGRWKGKWYIIQRVGGNGTRYGRGRT